MLNPLTLLFLSLATTPEDYEPSPGYLVFQMDTMEGEPVCTSVPIVNDDIAERIEFFSVTLEAESVYVEINESASTLRVFIKDDDGMIEIILYPNFHKLNVVTRTQTYIGICICHMYIHDCQKHKIAQGLFGKEFEKEGKERVDLVWR